MLLHYQLSITLSVVYYIISCNMRASATGQPTKSVQCNPIVEAEVIYPLYYISPGGHATPGRA